MSGPPRRPRTTLALLGASVIASPGAWGQDAQLARNLAATCVTCHGGPVRSEMKSLAGMPAAVILARLAEFRSGAAPATVMHQIVKGYSEAQLELIATHYADLPAPR